MNKKHCFIDSCEYPPIIVCNCEVSPIPLCKNHINEHSQLFRNHNFIPISSKIDESTRSSLIKLFSNIKSDIKAIKQTAINEQLSLIQQIHKATESILSKLKIYNKNVSEILSEISSIKEIDNSQSLSFVEKLLCKNEFVADRIQSPQLKLKRIEPNEIAKIFKFESTGKNFDFGIPYHHISTQTIMFLSKENKSQLTIFDAKTKKFTFICDVWSLGLGYGGTECLLPHNNLFCVFGSAWLTMDQMGKRTSIPCHLWNPNPGAVYVDGQIYLLGGYRRIAVKYVIERKKWLLISNFSISIGNTVSSCALFKNKILIGSSSSHPAFYDILIDSYSEISSLTLFQDTTKVFAVKNEKVFLFEFSGFVYENNDNLVTWNIIGDASCISIDKPIYSYPLIYKEKVFMVVEGKVHEFNLKENNWQVIDFEQ